MEVSFFGYRKYTGHRSLCLSQLRDTEYYWIEVIFNKKVSVKFIFKQEFYYRIQDPTKKNENFNSWQIITYPCKKLPPPLVTLPPRGGKKCQKEGWTEENKKTYATPSQTGLRYLFELSQNIHYEFFAIHTSLKFLNLFKYVLMEPLLVVFRRICFDSNRGSV